MSDMLRSPSWTEIEPEREVVLEEIAMVEDAPQDGVHDLATLAMFGDDDPLGHPILGEPDVIAGAQVANVAEFHRAAYGDPSIVLAAAGNVDHDAPVRARLVADGPLRRLPRSCRIVPRRAGCCRVAASSSRRPSSSTSASAGRVSPARTTIASPSRCST